MKNETEKLNKFKLAVFAEVEQQAQSIIAEAQAQQKQLLSEAKDESHNEILTELEKIDKEFEAGKVRAISSRKLEAQRNVLTHRNEMIDKVFSNIRKSLDEFCRSEQYPELLKKRLELCAQQTGGEKCTAYFAKRDLELGKELCKGTLFTAEPSQSITLGGVTVVCEASGIACDCSFDTSLAQQRQDFTKAAGLSQI